MLKFNLEEYKGSAERIIAARPVAEKVATEIHELGYSNILFTAVGGSLAPMTALNEYTKEISDIPIVIEQAAELKVKGSKRINENTIAITMSKSGDTKETVEITKWLQEKGIKVVGVTKPEDSPLAKIADWYVPMQHENGVEYEYMILYWLYFKILHLRGDFPNYERFADQLEKLPENLLRIKQEFEPRADEIAKKYYDSDYQMWVGSSEMWGEVYLFSMCVLEEMQWMLTKNISSSEFFHGTLELLEENTPLFLVKGEGPSRQLDERVEKFAKQITKDLIVLDPKDFELKGIDDEFRWFIAPTIISTILVDRLAFYFEKYSGHDLDTRRYYRQFEY